MTHIEKLFESYNNAIEKSYDKFLEISRKNKKTNIKLEEIDNLIDGVIEKWYDAPLKEMDDLSPRQYINKLDANEAFDAFKQGTRLCDELPELLVHKLKSFEDNSVDKLMKIISDKALIENEEDFVIPLAAIGLLGKWKVEKAAVPLLELLFELDTDNELFMDHISVTLSEIGGQTDKLLIEKIEALEPKGEVYNSLLYALSLIGEKHKSDNIYKCLRNSFMRMDDKIYAAACLCDYGDSRAISLLRGFIEKNKKSITKELYYGLRHEVESLGGKMDDILVDFID